MSEINEDLEGHFSVQRSRIEDHLEYDCKILMTQYGWAKRGHSTYWYATTIEPLNEIMKKVNTMSNTPITDKIIYVLGFIAIVVVWMTA